MTMSIAFFNCPHSKNAHFVDGSGKASDRKEIGNHFGLCARICKRSQLSGFLNEARTPDNADNSAKALEIKGFAMEMTLRVRDDETLKTVSISRLGAWKPAQDAGSHISTATATTGARFH